MSSRHPRSSASSGLHATETSQILAGLKERGVEGELGNDSFKKLQNLSNKVSSVRNPQWSHHQEKCQGTIDVVVRDEEAKPEGFRKFVGNLFTGR